MELWIPGRLPGMEELIQARGRKMGRSNGYQELKKAGEQRVALAARNARVTPLPPCFFTYLFIEPNKRRDPLNVIAGGIKIIEDGLRKCKILENDGWKHVRGIATFFFVHNEKPGVFVITTSAQYSKFDALDQLANYQEQEARKECLKKTEPRSLER